MSSTAEELLTLGLALTSPWKIIGQHLDTSVNPHRLNIRIGAERGSLYPCPECGALCKAHDFKEFTWRHLNFFQHHCYLTADVPRIKCPKHGIKRVKVPWARKGSQFTLLFEQVAMSLVREMPVSAAARIIEITDKRLWRIVKHYVSKAMSKLDLSLVKAIGLDETSSKRGHKYVTVFIDLDRRERPVIFATAGKGKECLKRFKEYLKRRKGNPSQIAEVVCDMSRSFLSGIKENFENAEITVDWFHVVQLFTRAVDEVRKAEQKETVLPKGTRWAVLKSKETNLTASQQEALLELETKGFLTATAYRIKEQLRWIRHAENEQAIKWRITRFINYAYEQVGCEKILAPVRKALKTFEKHAKAIARRWLSGHSNRRTKRVVSGCARKSQGIS